MKTTSQFPNDADGDILRHLMESGFDFDIKHSIDFNVDFGSWPPAPSFLESLRAIYISARLIEPQDGYEGYVIFTVRGRVSYELVTLVQQSITELAEPFGGVCESWGVLH